MPNSPELTIAERKLVEARVAFNLDRQQLQTALLRLNAVADSHDHLINTADEFGVDRALEGLLKIPSTYGLRVLSDNEIDELRPLLTRAYETCHLVDAALAEREHLLMRVDPSHVKVIQIGHEEACLDPERSVLLFPQTQRSVQESA